LQIFSPSLWLVFHFLSSLFYAAENFNLNEVQCINLSFVDYVFGVSKKSSQNPRLSRFCPMLSSMSFIVFHLIFRYVIHFELILVKATRSVSWSIFFFFCMWLSIVLPTFVKRPSWLYCIAIAPLSNITPLYLWDMALFLASVVGSIYLFVFLSLIPHYIE
jgi:hypothetical protein